MFTKIALAMAFVVCATAQTTTGSSRSTTPSAGSMAPTGPSSTMTMTATTAAPTVTTMSSNSNITTGWSSGDWTYLTSETYLDDPNNVPYLAQNPSGYPYLCTHVQGEFMLEVEYPVTNGGNNSIKFYMPSTAEINPTASYCDKFLGEVTMSDQHSTVLQMSESVFALDAYDGAANLMIKFSNNTKWTAGWMQWSIVEITFEATPTSMPALFPNAMPGKISYTGQTSPGSDKSEAAIKNRWWHRMSTQQESTYQCDHIATQFVTDGLTFNMQNMVITALQMGMINSQNTTFGNNTYDDTKCNWDFEKDDGLAVIIGSVQTAFVVVTLIIYLIYLKRRGPVKVPMWIIEPSMRNAVVKPISSDEYERKMSQISGDNGVPVKRDPNGGYTNDKY